jgi:hypothetical protein
MQITRRKGRRLPAAPLPYAPGQVGNPRFAAASGARARDQRAACEGLLSQGGDHWRLGRQLRRVLPPVSIPEALAGLGDTDEVAEIELRAHIRQDLKGKVEQAGHDARHGRRRQEAIFRAIGAAPTEAPQLLQLPHDVLVDLFVRLDLHALGRLAVTCRLLQYGQSSPHTFNPVEDALIFLAVLHGWSRTLPVDARNAVKCLLRLALQGDLESQSISADMFFPISLFVDSDGFIRSCGVEMQSNEDTETLLANALAAPAGSLGFGINWTLPSSSACLRKEGPTLVPAAEGVRMRSVSTGGSHRFALTNEGQVYMWGQKMKLHLRFRKFRLFLRISAG